MTSSEILIKALRIVGIQLIQIDTTAIYPLITYWCQLGIKRTNLLFFDFLHVTFNFAVLDGSDVFHLLAIVPRHLLRVVFTVLNQQLE